ncbi:MAG: hypothetical protein ACRDMZ_05195, partial [Solirubrobacteraceae bacterium]
MRESPHMQKVVWSIVVLAAVSCAHPSAAGAAPAPAAPAAAKPAEAKPADADELKPEEKTSRGAVTVGGRRIDYTAVAGTLIAHPKDHEEKAEAMKAAPPGPQGEKPQLAAAAMSYVAYFASGADPSRSVMFVYNGGPGSATVWLHMGAF